MDLSIIIGSVIAFLLFLGVFLARRAEKKAWNKGFCKKTGYPWKHFDTDSQGGRLYKAGLGNYCDISYNVER